MAVWRFGLKDEIRLQPEGTRVDRYAPHRGRQLAQPGRFAPQIRPLGSAICRSGTGNTEAMAHAVAEGARKAGASVDEVTADQFSATDVEKYDTFAFGCPAMGSEMLEEDVFQPMWDAIKGLLGEKKTALFGSYGWGTGEWMESWRTDAEASGVHVVTTAIANDEPDDDALGACREAGEALI